MDSTETADFCAKLAFCSVGDLAAVGDEIYFFFAFSGQEVQMTKGSQQVSLYSEAVSGSKLNPKCCVLSLPEALCGALRPSFSNAAASSQGDC